MAYKPDIFIRMIELVVKGIGSKTKHSHQAKEQIMVNLRMRLEKLADSRAWAKLHFADSTTIVGRLLRVGHDYVELESYSNPDKPHYRDYSRHLIPLSLVKYLTVESSTFAEAERARLDYISGFDESDPESTLPELEK
jgi:hypothetical protein